MKKTIFLLVAILTVSFAQNPTSKFQLGLIGGLNIVTVDVQIVNEGADVSSSTNFGFGGVLDWRLNQTFSLRLEPMYLKSDLGKTEADVNPGIYFYSKSSFLELPIFIKADFDGNVRPYIFVGPSFGILLSSELSAEFNEIIFKGDSESASEKLNVSLAFGGGISYPMDKFSIFLEGRYVHGLTNNIKGGTVTLSGGHVTQGLDWDKKTDSLKYRGYQIMGGVTFPL